MASDQIKLICPNCKKEDLFIIKLICMECRDFMEPEQKQDRMK